MAAKKAKAKKAPREMTDARCAWRAMTEKQRHEFLDWIGFQCQNARQRRNYATSIEVQQ